MRLTLLNYLVLSFLIPDVLLTQTKILSVETSAGILNLLVLKQQLLSHVRVWPRPLEFIPESDWCIELQQGVQCEDTNDCGVVFVTGTASSGCV